MKHATLFLLCFIFPCIATQIHAQRLVRMTPGYEVYKQPRASSALDEARVYQMRFLNNRNQTDLYHFNLSDFVKSFEANESDFFVQIEEISHRQTEPKMKTTEKKVKAKDGTQTIQTKYTVRSSVICDYKMVVFSKQFDTLLVAQKSGVESFCSATCKTPKEAWCSFNSTKAPFSSHTKDICDYLISVFNDTFKDSYKTVPFRLYNSNKKDYVMFRKGYTYLSNAFSRHQRNRHDETAAELLEQSDFYLNAFLTEINDLPLSHSRRQKLRYAVHFNLSQIHFLRGDYVLMDKSINKAISLHPNVIPRNYDSKLMKIASKCSQRQLSS